MSLLFNIITFGSARQAELHIGLYIGVWYCGALIYYYSFLISYSNDVGLNNLGMGML